jgi:hypothetical protein
MPLENELRHIYVCPIKYYNLYLRTVFVMVHYEQNAIENDLCAMQFDVCKVHSFIQLQII